jgi:(p)ppGpp synthase/HD superfamily hydrolase
VSSQPAITLEAAMRLATRAHEGQTDLGGQPYIGHPLRVMGLVPGVDAKLVAVLHDVLEDTDVGVDDLRAHGVPEPVIQAVRILTRSPGETYERFIERVAASGNRLAILVKLADLHDNTDPDRAIRGRPDLAERYADARRRLRRALDGMPAEGLPGWLGRGHGPAGQPG